MSRLTYTIPAPEPSILPATIMPDLKLLLLNQLMSQEEKGLVRGIALNPQFSFLWRRRTLRLILKHPFSGAGRAKLA